MRQAVWVFLVVLVICFLNVFISWYATRDSLIDQQHVKTSSRTRPLQDYKRVPRGDREPVQVVNRHPKYKHTNSSPPRVIKPDETIPELFMERLDRLLPDCPPNNITCDSHIRLFPNDIARLEREILDFHINKKIIVKFVQGEYVSIQYYRWMNDIDKGRVCPNCELRHNSKKFEKWNQVTNQSEVTHVHYNQWCPYNDNGMREHFHQTTFGDCGEAVTGSGKRYFKTGHPLFDYNAAYHDPTNNSAMNPFLRTYFHLHFSPDNRHNLPELKNVTDVARLLLRPPARFPRNPNATEVTMFAHNSCFGYRGTFVKKLVKLSNLTVAFYGTCMHNRESGLNDKTCANVPREQFYHQDCEAHRDSTKTVLSSWHKFSFALENTFSPDYFTEKRYQVFYASSVPIVWNNNNSLAYLPDPDAAVVVDKDKTNHTELGNYLQNMDEAEYQKFFAWKLRGLRPSFVRKLFLSTDFLACRICEYMAKFHFYD